MTHRNLKLHVSEPNSLSFLFIHCLRKWRHHLPRPLAECYPKLLLPLCIQSAAESCPVPRPWHSLHLCSLTLIALSWTWVPLRQLSPSWLPASSLALSNSSFRQLSEQFLKAWASHSHLKPFGDSMPCTGKVKIFSTGFMHWIILYLIPSFLSLLSLSKLTLHLYFLTFTKISRYLRSLCL